MLAFGGLLHVGFALDFGDALATVAALGGVVGFALHGARGLRGPPQARRDSAPQSHKGLGRGEPLAGRTCWSRARGSAIVLAGAPMQAALQLSLSSASFYFMLGDEKE
ncbi:unnamed protein product [Prorocentrum cordatum]|uniref:Uncharacterized protein n=1 Tax=Prorocentrum cordatum TaxID=2364126 RepID=A0ABN9XET9_9DINO|nr:unnamed protein product [Polarella glacialis]